MDIDGGTSGGQLVMVGGGGDGGGPPPCKLARKQVIPRVHCDGGDDGSSTDGEIDVSPLKSNNANIINKNNNNSTTSSSEMMRCPSLSAKVKIDKLRKM